MGDKGHRRHKGHRGVRGHWGLMGHRRHKGRSRHKGTQGTQEDTWNTGDIGDTRVTRDIS